MFCGMVGMLLLASCSSSTESVNHPPTRPSNPVPADDATDQSVDVTLSWSCSDPDGDALTYDVYFGEPSDPPKVSSSQTNSTYDPGTLGYATTYNWKIKAKDTQGNSSTGSVWNFTTMVSDSEAAPTEPSNPNPADGAEDVSTNLTLSWTCSDPNGDPITYDVYFGTSSPPPLVNADQPAMTYPLLGLDASTTYYWKIDAEDDGGNSTAGPVWSFTTIALSSNQIASFGSLPRWSPDGQKLLFGGEGVNAGLWIYDQSSGSVDQVTDDSYPHLWDYSWSSASDQIAFGGAGAIIDSTSGIFTVVLGGSYPLRWHPTGHSPCWIPDGSGLVFAENDPESGTYGLFRLIFADTSLTHLTNSGTDPCFNPTGIQIAYRDEPGSSLAYPLMVITASGTPVAFPADTCLHFAWTADGATLVYDYMLYDPSDTGMRICKVPGTGGIQVKIVSSASEPSVASTGLIAYHRVVQDLSYGIYAVNLDGSDNHQLTGSGSQPSITPDGSLIAYARSDGIWLVTP